MKLTKNELKIQSTRLVQLMRYLPTLQLKKAMLQAVVAEARLQVATLQKEIDSAEKKLFKLTPLLAENQVVDFKSALTIKEIITHSENIAGIEVPVFQEAILEGANYSFLSTPVWVCQALEKLKGWKRLLAKKEVLLKKKALLEEELRQVSIRVNLFEKVLIPRHIVHIKKIKVFLGDLSLAEIATAKAAKNLLEQKKGAEL